MKKYILLLLFLAVIVPLGKIFAQNDTFSFVFKNFPTQHYFHQLPIQGCGPSETDTMWHYIFTVDGAAFISGTFISDSLVRNKGSIIFLHRDTTKKIRERLMISYNASNKTIDSLSYSRVYDTLRPHSGGAHYNGNLNMSLSNVKITDENGLLSGSIQGDSLSHESKYAYKDELKVVYCDEDEIFTFLNIITDSTALTFQMTDREFLGAAVFPPVLSEINLFPNPASDFVHVQIPDMNVKEITITDLLGRNVLRFKNQSDNPTLDITALLPGIYYLRAGSRVEKLVVQR